MPAAFVKMFGELAAKNHAALVPNLLEGVVGDPKLNLPDGIHPNAAGHKILVENVWRVLEPIAREVGPNKRRHLRDFICVLSSRAKREISTVRSESQKIRRFARLRSRDIAQKQCSAQTMTLRD